MSRHARQMSIRESDKQALFTHALGNRYGNYQITGARTRARQQRTIVITRTIICRAAVRARARSLGKLTVSANSH